MSLIRFIVLLLLISCSDVTAQQSSWKSNLQLQSIMMLTDEQAEQYSAEQVERLNQNHWQKMVVDEGYVNVRDGVNWFQLTLYNPNADTVLSHIVLGNRFEVVSASLYQDTVQPTVTSIDFTLQNTNLWSGQIIAKGNGQLVVYMKVVSERTEALPFKLTTSTDYFAEQSNKQYYFGFTVGGVLFVALVFGLLFVAVHDLSLMYLAGYFICRAGILSVLLGGHLFYLMPNSADLRGFELPWLVSFSSIFYLLFTSVLFQLNETLPTGQKALKIFAILIAAFAPLSLVLSVSVNIFISGLIMTSVMALLAGLGLFLHIKGKRLAFLFFIAMSLQLMFTFAILVGFYFQVPLVRDREFLHIASFTLNTLLIVFIVARQYYYLLQDKQKAQKEALTNAIASEKANEKLLKMQVDSQEELEHRVQERTLELNIALNELEELNRELEQKNTIDELTGLYNRRFYDQKILAEYRRSKRNLTPLSLVVIDIDYFKKINDTYGHLAGDQCLSWLAQHIKQSLKRSSDVGCRYGGEEFCLILPDTERDGAIGLAQDLRKAIEAFDFIYQDIHISLTISCGVTTYTQQENIDPIHIFDVADKALYKAKRSGRNQVQSLDITKEQLTPESSDD